MVFSLLLTVTILVNEGKLDQNNVMFLFGGGQSRNLPPNPVTFLSPQAWSEFCASVFIFLQIITQLQMSHRRKYIIILPYTEKYPILYNCIEI